MSLYDGMGLDGNQSEKAAGWSTSFTMLKSQLEAKKAALTKAKHEKFRSGAPVIAPVINLNKITKTDEQIDFSYDDRVPTDPKPAPFLGGDQSLDQFADEYDPRYPNEYEKVVRKRREKRQRDREDEKQREIEDRRKKRDSRHSDRDRRSPDDRSSRGRIGGPGSGFSRRPDSDEEDDYEREKRMRASAASKAAIAPPTNLIEEDKKAEVPPPLLLSGGAGTQFAHNLAGSVAHKIMTRYGFKEGLGLGKGNKGISHALQVEKTSKRGGKIISSSQIEKQLEEEKKREQEEKESVANLLKNPTKVVCLRNMVGPGEVDQELEGETSEECSKYGEVKKCIIYEMVGQQDIEEEAVRIFIEFERLESAIKAVVDLNGRYFGGRTVKACFYDINKFHDFLLGDPV